MPKLTDTLFRMVLRHMPLRELYLCSMRDSVKSVLIACLISTYEIICTTELVALSLLSLQITIAGLKSLKTGIFAKSIEIFRLKLNLENVRVEEVEQLEKEFRSSQMI